MSRGPRRETRHVQSLKKALHLEQKAQESEMGKGLLGARPGLLRSLTRPAKELSLPSTM